MGGSKSKEEVPVTEEEKKVPKVDINERLKEFPLHTAPKDSDGFIQSFEIDDEENYLKFFNEYGFVVVNNILDKEDVDKSIDEMWKILEANPWGWDENKLVKRDDPSTWEEEYWPGIKKLGILGNSEAIGPMSWKNRQNPKLFKVYSKLMNMKELWVAVDRWGIMRPTVGLPPLTEDEKSQGLTSVDRPAWRTAEVWLHWDLNPWRWMTNGTGKEYEFNNFITENNATKNEGHLKLQGLVCLTESTEDDGGFCTISGFSNHLKEWVNNTIDTDFCEREYNRDFVNVPKGDPMVNQVQKISARPGSLIVWRSEQPHCNFPNRSNRFRMNQYIKMFPAHEGATGTKLRAEAIRQMIPKDFEISPLGMKLFGIESWNEKKNEN